jgi:8-oxo-dGTP pyrophosphatase MutT (NUDIX family)
VPPAKPGKFVKLPWRPGLRRRRPPEACQFRREKNAGQIWTHGELTGGGRRRARNLVCQGGEFVEQRPVILDLARTALESYLPGDVREAGFRRRMLELLRLPLSTSRRHFEPGHFTASAFVVSPERDAVLLIFHKKLGIWVQPGGHIEPTDESLLGAAQREVAEEVGLELDADGAATIFDLDVHAIPARKDEPAHEHFDVRFCFHSPTRAFAQSDEVADARWAPLAELEQLTCDESVLRAARKLGAPERR